MPPATEALENLQLREVRREFCRRERGIRRHRSPMLSRLHGTHHKAVWTAAAHGFLRHRPATKAGSWSRAAMQRSYLIMPCSPKIGCKLFFSACQRRK